MLKRAISTLLCIAMLLTLLAASGCTEKEETVRAAVAEKVTNVYKTDYVIFPEGLSSSGGGVMKNKDRLYVICSQVVNQETYEQEFLLYSVDMNGENPETKPINIDLANGYIACSEITDDGSLVFAANAYDQETMGRISVLTKFDAEGNTVFSFDPSTLVSQDDAAGNDMFYSSGFYVNKILSDSSGNLYLQSSSCVVVLNPNGEKLFEVTAEGSINNLCVNGDNVIISYYDAQYNTIMKKLNFEDQKLGDTVNLPTGNDKFSTTVLLGDGYDYYLKDQTAVYGFNEGDEDKTMLLNWINSDIVGDEAYNLTIVDADKFAYLYQSNTNGTWAQPGIAVLTRIPDDEVQAKYLIRMVTLSRYMDSEVTSMMVAFNRESLTHRIYLDNYSRFDDPNVYDSLESESVKILSAEIAAGNGPDIVMMNTSGMLFSSLEEKGFFVDLYEFIEKDDTFKRDDILKCLRTPIEKDGKLYKLVTYFSVNSLIGKTKNVEHLKDNWSFQTMLDYAMSLPEGQSLLGEGSQTNMLTTFVTAGISEFINPETKECSFDSELFKKLLDYCSTLPASFDYSSVYNNPNRFDDYRNDKVMLDSLMLSSFGNCLRAPFGFGTDELTILGFPGIEGGAIITPYTSYAISSKTAPEIQEGAWQFLKKLATDESKYLNEYGMSYSWGSTYSSVEKCAEKEMNIGYKYYNDGTYDTSIYQTLPDGTEQEIGMTMRSTTTDSGTMMRLKEEDIAFIKEYLDTVTSTITYDEQIMKIISEETSPFFAGAKTLDETAKVIQSKVSIYISENQ